MSVKVPIRTVFDGSTATGLAEYQSGEFIGLTHGGTGASLSIGSAGQVLKVNSGGSALEFGAVEAIVNIDNATNLTANTLVVGDQILVSDGGTEGRATLSQVATAILAAPTITGTAVMTNLDISGDVDVDGTLEADAITVNGATLTETITDLVGGMVSSNTETGITVTFQDADNTLDFALGSAQTTITSLLATDIKIGEDDETKIDFETANEIHFYASNAEQVFVSDGVFGPQTDSDVDLGTTGVRWKDAFIDTITTTGLITSGSNLVIANDGNIGSAGDTDAIAIDSSGNVTASQNLVVTGDFTVNGTTTTVSTTNLKVSDTLIELNTGATSNANDMGIIMERGSTGNNAIFMFDESVDEFTVGTTTATNDATGNISITAGTFTAATLKGNLVVADDGDVGSASATDAMQISSAGIVTFKDDILIKDGGTIGVASSTSAITIASTGIVTLVDDLLLKDACTIGTATTAGAIAIAADGTVDLDTAGATVASAVIKTAGLETIWVPSAAMRPTVSNGCAALTEVETTSGRPDLQVLDFDKDADEAAQFQIAFPKSWNEGTITFAVYYIGLAATTGVAFGLQGVSVGDNEEADQAYGTAVVVTDDSQGDATEVLITATSGAVTLANSPAAGDISFFRLFRDVSDGNDDMAGDARVLGVKIFFTTNAANDA